MPPPWMWYTTGSGPVASAGRCTYRLIAVPSPRSSDTVSEVTPSTGGSPSYRALNTAWNPASALAQNSSCSSRGDDGVTGGGSV